MTPIPTTPAGPSGLVQMLKTILACLRERTPIEGEGIRFERKGHGIVIHATRRGSGGGGSSASTGDNRPAWL